jgi:carboxynorspermidine decarboxylase
MDYSKIVSKTPCYIVDKGLLGKNLEVLGGVQERSGCKIVLALKAFAMFSVFPLVREHLTGTSASGLYEARLGFEEFGPVVHTCAPAYRPDEFDDILKYSSHVVFNSLSQWELYRQKAVPGRNVKCGIRVNPEHSEVKVPLYDPCAPGSRLGIRRKDLRGADLSGITGIHFHTLCELNADALQRTLGAVEERFGDILKKAEWVNLGGGHHITRADYDIELLIKLIKEFRSRYDVEVFLEPGEAVALDAGLLLATVLDVTKADMDVAILDTSAAAHMPDVLEMPYRPEIAGAGEPGEKEHTYRLAGMTCLAGDVMGEYSFDAPLRSGDRVVFRDMAHYTMVKNNTFNGMGLPSICLYDPDRGTTRTVREFGYGDYRRRLS